MKIIQKNITNRNQEENKRKAAIPIRQIDTDVYLDVMRELVQSGRTVSITISGSSMSPFLIDRRDRVVFEKPSRALKRGDIVFYQRESGQYVMHRIWKIKNDGYYLVGDAQTEVEGPIRSDQIFALVTSCERKGKRMKPGNFWWDFFGKIWIRMVPLRPLIWNSYERLRKWKED